VGSILFQRGIPGQTIPPYDSGIAARQSVGASLQPLLFMEGSAMKSKPVSLRRRHLMLAGAAAIAAPSGVFALPAVSGFLPGETLLVSGRIVDETGRPVTGAWIASAGALSTRTITRTDGDGRFMLMTELSGAETYVEYGAPEPRSSAQRRTRIAYREAPARFQRDEQGVWRTTVTLTAA
jgi:hypothetical protein